MRSFSEFLTEAKKYTAWQFPEENNLRQEYNVEYKHHFKGSYGDVWPTYEEFKAAVKKGKVVEFDKNDDRKVSNRSRTDSYESLLGLISGYASYPEFRNEKTLKSLYDRVAENKSLNMPIIMKFPSGRLQIFAGNTRADVALQSGSTYKAIVVDVPE